MTPTARSLALLRRLGWQVAVVEKWLPRVNLRSDLWHFADVLAVHPEERRFLLAQVTVIGHLTHRLAKVKSRPEAAAWLRAGGEIEVHGWVKRTGRWHVKRVQLQAGDLEPITLASPPRKRRRSRWQQAELF